MKGFEFRRERRTLKGVRIWEIRGVKKKGQVN